MSESRSCRDGVVPTQAILVPTEDTTRFSYLMRTLITVDKPVFVTGMTGTGKTVMVQNLLRSLEPYPDEGGLAVVPTFMNFSAQTLSLITQQAIESKLEKKRKNLLGAPAGKKCIFFVDDINMPLVESWLAASRGLSSEIILVSIRRGREWSHVRF